MSDLWTDPASDPRTYGDPNGELATYREYLANYRLTLRMKCEGLSPEQLASRSVPPSTLSLLGLVRHLARVEHSWFQRVAQQSGEDRLYWTPEDRDHEFNAAVGTQACVDDAFATWEREMGKADQWLDGLSDGDLGGRLTMPGDEGTLSIRDMLVHMVEEYARHCGHADLLRECIDGRTGQ